MDTPKVCLGCFCEWEEDKKSCPHCGWDPEREKRSMCQWTTGDVLDKRYLVGEVYLQAGDRVIWRIYDNLLGIAGFAMRSTQDQEEELLRTARLMKEADQQKSADSGSEILKILALKQIDEKYVLVFSLSNRFLDAKQFEQDYLSAEQSLPAEDSGKVLDREIEGIKEQSREVLPPGTLLENRYRILYCIGIGGFGITYLCEDLYLHREVAVKEYFPAGWAERDEEYVTVKQSEHAEAYRFGMQSFLKECKITAKFIHMPHIITIYDVLMANDTVYLVMEYIDGISIGREFRMREHKPYTKEEVAGIMAPVLDALEEIHDKRIIHSDISPGNIMRAKSGEIILIDMGAAKYNLESQPALGTTFLKIDYAAPEQYRTARQGKPTDEGPWTDVYGAGATMYYLLTGHKPTDVISRLEGKDTEITFSLKERMKLPGKWRKIIQHAMKLERTERIGSARELKEEIKKIL